MLQMRQDWPLVRLTRAAVAGIVRPSSAEMFCRANECRESASDRGRQGSFDICVEATDGTEEAPGRSRSLALGLDPDLDLDLDLVLGRGLDPTLGRTLGPNLGLATTMVMAMIATTATTINANQTPEVQSRISELSATVSLHPRGTALRLTIHL